MVEIYAVNILNKSGIWYLQKVNDYKSGIKVLKYLVKNQGYLYFLRNIHKFHVFLWKIFDSTKIHLLMLWRPSFTFNAFVSSTGNVVNNNNTSGTPGNETMDLRWTNL